MAATRGGATLRARARLGRGRSGVVMDRQFWTFVNSFAPWLSAVGTICAVITALYLARRGDRIRLRVRCGIRIVVAQGGRPGSAPQYVNLEVTNVGRRTATITTLY